MNRPAPSGYGLAAAPKTRTTVATGGGAEGTGTRGYEEQVAPPRRGGRTSPERKLGVAVGVLVMTLGLGGCTATIPAKDLSQVQSRLNEIPLTDWERVGSCLWTSHCLWYAGTHDGYHWFKAEHGARYRVATLDMDVLPKQFEECRLLVDGVTSNQVRLAQFEESTLVVETLPVGGGEGLFSKKTGKVYLVDRGGRKLPEYLVESASNSQQHHLP